MPFCMQCGFQYPDNARFCGGCGQAVAARTVGPSQSKLASGVLLNNRYRLDKVLGQGGFAITYQAFDTVLQVARVVKEYFPEGSVRESGLTLTPPPSQTALHQTLTEKFLDEARLIAAVNHAGVIKMIDFFYANNTAYYVTEYQGGQSLGQLLAVRQTPFTVAEISGWLEEIADALAAVHGQGLLHQDIKPDNIIITESGKAVLIDFGAARAYAAGKTQRYSITYTPGYAPPEQQVEQAKRGPYTDIYALGATLYELLTKALPSDAPLRHIQPNAFVRPGKLNSQLPGKVDEAIVWALEILPEKRPQTIKAFMEKWRGGVDNRGNSSSNGDPQTNGRSTAGKVSATVSSSLAIVVAADGSGQYRDLAVAVKQAPAGATLSIKSGDYSLSEPLVIKKSLTLNGAGWENARILCSAQGSVVSIFGDIKVRLKGLAFVHQGDMAADVISVSDAEIEMQHCHCTGGAKPSVSVYGSGIRLSGHVRSMIAICSFVDNQSCGIVYSDNSQGVAKENNCSSNGWSGIRVIDEASPKLKNNSCEGNAQTGIAYSDKAQGVAKGNNCSGNGWGGIEVIDQASPTLENNCCERNGEGGIIYYHNSQGVAKGNNCSSNVSGIEVIDEASPTLENNRCEGNVEDGIIYSDNSQGVAKGNNCSSNGWNGIRVIDKASPTLESNHCGGNAGSGIIYAGNSQGVAKGNACNSNGLHGIYVSDETSPMVWENICQRNKDTGLCYLNNARGSVRFNRCSGNKKEEIYLAKTAQPALEGNVGKVWREGASW